MLLIPSIVLMRDSSTSVTSLSTMAGLAPSSVVRTTTIGNSTFGILSTPMFMYE